MSIEIFFFVSVQYIYFVILNDQFFVTFSPRFDPIKSNGNRQRQKHEWRIYGDFTFTVHH